MNKVPEEAQPRRTAALFVVIAATMWGIDSVVLRPALYTLPVSVVVFIECLTVTVFLTPFYVRRIREVRFFSGIEWLAFAGVAVFGVVIGTMAITRALFYVNYVNLSIVVLLQKLQPVITLVGAAILLKEKLPRTFFLWSLVALLGVYIMTFGLTMPDMNTGDKTFMAAVYALIAAASFSLATIFSKRVLRRVDYGLGTYIRFLLSAFIMLIIVLVTGNLAQITTVTGYQFGIFLLIALTSGGLSTFLYYYGLTHITASLASICELAFPLTAVLLEFILRGNILNTLQWAGVLTLFLAIFKVTRMQMKSS